ncbi:hypothetical protein ADICYQ_3318 [Cyclobacterium qasimii M12-11B]|uniref:Uncharacterized protein n=1 Tax=Cyclobacterium qasimii M12-11B TaxID=641524 RepID=S7WUA8_9BACT|nr:hypothetical protein ADICYQ_3318 [Cyclobacterium qasimii M12-11B]
MLNFFFGNLHVLIISSWNAWLTQPNIKMKALRLALFVQDLHLFMWHFRIA